MKESDFATVLETVDRYGKITKEKQHFREQLPPDHPCAHRR